MSIQSSGFSGKPMRFTPVQMKRLRSIFMMNFACRVTGDEFQKVARWLHYGEDGHAIWPEHWWPKSATLVWALIQTQIRLGHITKTQVTAFKRRQRWLVTTFKLSAIDLLSTEAWLEG